MGHGSGPGGHIDLKGLAAFSPADIRTEVHLRLPFGVPGLHGPYDVRTSEGTWQLQCSAEYLPPKLVMDQLEGTTATFDDAGRLTEIAVGNSKSGGPPTSVIALNPDRWGRSWRTHVVMTSSQYIDPEYDDTRPAFPVIAQRVLVPCCACLNRVLDTLVHVGGTAILPHVVPSDFWGMRVRYLGPSGHIGSFEVRKLHTVWWGPRTARMHNADAEFRTCLADPEGLPITDELLASSERKSSGGDYRGAVIDAVCAVEAAVGFYLARALAQRGISSKKRKEFLGPTGVGLAMRATVLLPLIHEMELPAEILDAFAASNSKRNRIVHAGERANAREAANARAAATMIIDCLRGYSRVVEHWDGQSFRLPRPAI